MKIEYKYGKKNIEAEVIYSDRKTMDLRIFPEGNIQITVPKNTSIEKIVEKVKPKSKWILQQQRTFELFRPFAKERLYIPGETHLYLGRQYKLVINKTEQDKTNTNLGKGLFTITTKNDNIELIIQKFYKSKADIIFKELLGQLLSQFPQFNRFDITLTHRFMKKRWGSCSMNGNILLNTELIKANKACIEYVILHELCHLIHPNHSKDFYKTLTEVLPSWEKIKLNLERSLS